MKNKGFTLVELVITIAIVIILSVVSVPIYRGYVNKAKMAEGYALLGTLLSAQKAYFSEYGNFFDDGSGTPKADTSYYTCNEPILGIDARGNKYFTWFNVGEMHCIPDGDIKSRISIRVRMPEELITDPNKPALSLLYYATNSNATKFKITPIYADN